MSTAPAVASADPLAATSLVGVGSDTSQDLYDAYAGGDPAGPSASTKLYTPLLSGGTTNQIITSWDAVPAGGTSAAPGCISTKAGGPSFDRPNGSSAGISALLAAINSTGWEASSASCTNAVVSVTGQIDFARSARGPKSPGSTLTFIPFARDAIGVAYWDHSTGHLASLTTAQLQALYTGTSTTINGDTVDACLPVVGSAVRTNLETALNVTEQQAASAASPLCSGIEQNGGNTFYSLVSTLPAGTDAVVPFSSGSWISQANGNALDRSATARANGVDLAAIDALGQPYTGTAPSELPNTTYYQSTSYGVTLYTVAQTSKVAGLFANAVFKGLFVGATSAFCSAPAQATAHTFGFDSLTAAEATCGATTLTGNS